MSFSSSESALTPHCQWIRYILRSLAFKALHNCTPIHPLHTSRLPASALCFMLAPLQCCPTFSRHSARPIFSLASPWEPPTSPKPMYGSLFYSLYYQSIILYILSFSKNLFENLYEPGIVLDAKETKINVIFSKLAGLTIRTNNSYHLVCTYHVPGGVQVVQKILL